MSSLVEFRKLEQQLAAQLAELEVLKKDSGLKAEIQFEEKLRALMAEYGFSLRNVIDIFHPKTAPRSAASVGVVKAPRKPRVVKVYKNPHNGEIIETKGGNHTLLKAWKAEHGAETVDSWLAS